MKSAVLAQPVMARCVRAQPKSDLLDTLPIGRPVDFAYVGSLMAPSLLAVITVVTVCACSGAQLEAAPTPKHVAKAERTPPSDRTHRVAHSTLQAERKAEAEPAVEGDGLSSDQITPVVQECFPAMRGCHTMEFGGGGRAVGGTMTVHLQINADGSVESADIADSSFASTTLDRCVIGIAKGIRFPSAAAPTDFSWRFKFRAPGSSDARSSSR